MFESRHAKMVSNTEMSGIDLLGKWLNEQTWKEVFRAETVDEKSEILQTMLLKKIDEFLLKSF